MANSVTSNKPMGDGLPFRAEAPWLSRGQARTQPGMTSWTAIVVLDTLATAPAFPVLPAGTIVAVEDMYVGLDSGSAAAAGVQQPMVSFGVESAANADEIWRAAAGIGPGAPYNPKTPRTVSGLQVRVPALFGNTPRASLTINYVPFSGDAPLEV